LKKIHFVALIIFCSVTREAIACNADSLKLLVLPEVSVFQNRQSLFKDDKFITRLDSQTLLKNQNASLGEALMFAMPVTIQQYGSTGSLTTLSFRGTGSNHTQVNWNGFPLNAIGTGEMDLSLAVADVADQIQLIHGASGAMYGSGTFGGAIEMNNIPDWNNRLTIKLNMGIGDFDNNIEGNVFSSSPGHLDSKDYSFKVIAGSDKIQYSLFSFASNALNEYRYIENSSFNPQELVQDHNRFDSEGFIQSLNLKIGNAQQIEAAIWVERKHYQIPFNPTNENQNDSTIKTYLKWNFISGTSSYTLKTGFFYDYLHYTDISVDSKIGSDRWFNDFNYRKYINHNIVFDAGMTFLRTFSNNSNFYSLHIDENMYAIYAAAKYSLSKLILDFSYRQEFITGYNPLPQFSLGGNWNLNKIITLKSNISNKYRVPSFNDKYWQPGGNPDLKPENGIGFDAGTEVNYSFSSISNKLTAAIYSDIIDDWIQWVPGSNGATFTAQNYKQVWTRGFEGEFDQIINFGKNSIIWSAKYDFTPSTSLKSEDVQIIGKQLMYIPLHSAVLNLCIKLHTINIGLDWAMRSHYYSNSAGQGLPVPGYSIINFDFNKTFLLKSNSFRIGFKINNLFDKQYFTLPAYPLPGRAFYISATYIFNKSGLPGSG
jgi:outer membrane cobalamin receptor